MWQDLASEDELPVGRQLCRTLGQHKVLLIRTEKGVHALENRCPHAEFPLHGGSVSDRLIRCPVHGARFDLASGQPIPEGSRLGPVRVFPAKLENGRVLVEDAQGTSQ